MIPFIIIRAVCLFSVVGALEGALASDVTVEFCISECPGILRGLGLDMLSDSCEAACQQ